MWGNFYKEKNDLKVIFIFDSFTHTYIHTRNTKRRPRLTPPLFLNSKLTIREEKYSFFGGLAWLGTVYL